MKNKNERRTFINNKWKVILSNILQRATSYRSVIKSNSVSCSKAARSLQQVTNGRDDDDGPSWSSTRWPLYSLSSLLHYCQQLQSPVAILFHFCFACVVHFDDFKDFVHPQFYNFRATNNRNCKSKSSKLYYQMVVDERYTKPLTRPLLFHAPMRLQ